MRTRSGSSLRITNINENFKISKTNISEKLLGKKRLKESILEKENKNTKQENSDKNKSNNDEIQIFLGSKNYKNEKNEKYIKKSFPHNTLQDINSNTKNKQSKLIISPPRLKEKNIVNENICIDLNDSKSNANTQVFNDTYVDSLMAWRQDNRPGTGLKNLGNTCFLNSVLQCILYTVPLKNYFNFSDHSQTCKVTGVCFICEYGRLSKMVHENKSSGGITPQNIIQNIKNIASHIKIGRQEDAHEFLLYFLSAMENSATNYVLSINKKYNKIKNKQIPHFFEDNLIQKLFGGSLTSTVTCKKCKSVSSRNDKFIDISLEVNNCESLSDCFDHFCKPEDLSGNNKYFCEKCQKRNDSIKKLSFQNFPRVIVIHLKRFDNFQRKIRKFIKYDNEINLNKYQVNANKNKTKEKVSYKLCSVLVHEGSSIYSGHYYCYVRVNGNEWYLFNDASVRKVEESLVLKQTPYLLFYEKIIDRNRIRILKTPNKNENTNSLSNNTYNSNLTNSNIKRRNAIVLDAIKARSLINNIKDHNNIYDLKRVLRGRK